MHSHPHSGPHRHIRSGPRRSEALSGPSHRPHRHDHPDHDHGEHAHSHGLIDESIKRSRDGIHAVSLSLAVLALAAIAQLGVFLASGSIALQ